MAVRIKDVANYCGLSPGAVSQVLRNNGHRIPEKTRLKILDAIDKLGYRPNNLSVGLRQKRSNLLSLIIPWNNPELMDTVEQEAYRHGFRLMVNFTTSPDANREIAHLDNALDWHVDGIIWLPFANLENYPERLIKRLKTSNAKLIFLQRRLSELPGTLVGTDYRQGIFDAVKYIAQESGYSKILYLQSGSPFEIRDQRRNYFKEAVAQYGLDHERVSLLNSDSPREERSKATDILIPLLEKQIHPVVCLCDNDWLALEVLDVARKKGIDIPARVGIITISDHLLLGHVRLSQVTSPKLSALRIDYAAQGKLAVQYIANMIDDKKEKDILLPLPLFINQSTQRINA